MSCKEAESVDTSTATQSPLPEEDPQDLLLDRGLDKHAVYPEETGLSILHAISKPNFSGLFRKFPVLKAVLGLTTTRAKRHAPTTVKQLLQSIQTKSKTTDTVTPPKKPKPRVRTCQMSGEQLYEDLGLLCKLRKVSL